MIGFLKNHWKLLILILAILLVLTFAGIKAYQIYLSNLPPVDIPEHLSRTYSGVRWIRIPLDMPDDELIPVTISIDGERSGDVSFRGSIHIKSGDEEIFALDDCGIHFYEDWGVYLISRPEIFLNPDYLTIYNYGIMMISSDWSEVSLLSLHEDYGPFSSEDLSRCVFVAPASTKEEGVEILKRISDGSPFEENSWD